MIRTIAVAFAGAVATSVIATDMTMAPDTVEPVAAVVGGEGKPAWHFAAEEFLQTINELEASSNRHVGVETTADGEEIGRSGMITAEDAPDEPSAFVTTDTAPVDDAPACACSLWGQCRSPLWCRLLAALAIGAPLGLIAGLLTLPLLRASGTQTEKTAIAQKTTTLAQQIARVLAEDHVKRTRGKAFFRSYEARCEGLPSTDPPAPPAADAPAVSVAEPAPEPPARPARAITDILAGFDNHIATEVVNPRDMSRTVLKKGVAVDALVRGVM